MNEQSRSHLSPCPFCDGTDIFIDADEYGSGGQGVPPYHCGCSTCQAEQRGETEEDAIAAWNRRAVMRSETAGRNSAADEWALDKRDFDACEALYSGDVACADDLPPEKRPHTIGGKRMFRYIYDLRHGIASVQHRAFASAIPPTEPSEMRKAFNGWHDDDLDRAGERANNGRWAWEYRLEGWAACWNHLKNAAPRSADMPQGSDKEPGADSTAARPGTPAAAACSTQVRDRTQYECPDGRRCKSQDRAACDNGCRKERSSTPTERAEPEDANMYFGKDCPKGMVQVEFVGVDPKLKRGEYGWKPSPHAFLEVYVDGQRFRIDVGDLGQHGHPGRRGIHVNSLSEMKVDAVNAWSFLLKESTNG